MISGERTSRGGVYSLSVKQTLDVIEKALSHPVLVQRDPILLILQPHFSAVTSVRFSEGAAAEF